MNTPISLISSMATRQLLAELAARYQSLLPRRIEIESVGGVDAARRVRDGEPFDAVVLAASAIQELIEAGKIDARSRVDLVRSGVAIAVRQGAARIDIGSEEAVRHAVASARSISYSTGPSGVHLAKLFERWGIAASIRERIVQAPPGVPVGSLVAQGQVELGFQQLSELIHEPGIQVLGPLPPDIQTVTTFSAGVTLASTQAHATRDFLQFLASPAALASKLKHGMEAP